MRVAIVGSGIAGLAAADALVGAHDVTLYEAAPRPGGHVYTVHANGLAIDMGFIVCNRERYPRFFALLDRLGIATRPTTMSVSVADGALEWGSESPAMWFADRRRVADPRHWRFLARVVAFLAQARRELHADRHGARTLAGMSLRELSLDDYLLARRVPADVREHFVVPLAAALWSLAPDRCGAFPAATYLGFLDHHGMLSPVAPLRWHTIVGGSRRYVDALLADLQRRGRFELRLATPVRSIVRDAGGVTIVGDGERRFDRVVVATHANTALALLTEPTVDERRVLGAFRYSTNRTVLHTDRSFLPRRQAAHAAWNYVADPDTARVAVTYSMTRLQGLPDAPYLVTLNPRRKPRGVIHDVTFEHPQLDLAALAAQEELARVGNELHTFYAGAHAGFGFHEDGMRSGQEAARRLERSAVRSRVEAAS